MLPETPDDVEPAWLSRLLGRDVRGVSATVIGHGFGFVGVVARVELDADDAPRSVVAKWCSAEDARAEERFCREVGPTIDVERAQVLAVATEGERAVLLLEDVRDAKQGDVLVGATPEEAQALIDAMASFHARHWGARDPALAGLPEWGPGPADRVRRTSEGIPRFLELWGERLSPSARAATERLPARLAAAYEWLARRPPTLIHSDLHLDNVMFKGGRAVVLDWTDAARGAPAVDLAHLLLDGTQMSHVRLDRRALVARYVEALAARGVREDVDALLADVGRFATFQFASEVRGLPPGLKLPDAPRVPIVVDMVLRVYAEASAEMDPS